MASSIFAEDSAVRRPALRWALGAMLVLATAARAAAAPPVQISACNGAVVPAHHTGVLTTDVQCGMHCDLDPSSPCDTQGVCSTDPTDTCSGDSIRLGRGSTLRLAGHVLTGAYNHSAVSCGGPTPGGSCSVLGPGVVSSTKGSAVTALGMSIHVRDLQMYGSYGALWSNRAVFVRDSAFGDWDGDAYGRTIHVSNATSSGHDGGFFAKDSVFLQRVATGSGINAGARIVGAHVTLTGGSCPPIDAPIVRLEDVDPPACAP